MPNITDKFLWIAIGLVLVVAVIVVMIKRRLNKDNTMGKGNAEERIPAGKMPEGIDPIVASVAVYPSDRHLSDVAEATLKEVNESEVKKTELGKHLPQKIPEGYRFKDASIYETRMKDESKYHLLRIRYSVDNSNGSFYTTVFSIQLTDFQPKASKKIYNVDSTPGVYIVFNAGELTQDEIKSILKSIK